MNFDIWNDCDGAVITTELLLVSSVLVAALLTGLGTLKQAITHEFNTLGTKVQSVKDPVADPPVVESPNDRIESPNVFLPEDLIGNI